MFDGLPNDQLLHQFITPSTRTSSSSSPPPNNNSLPIISPFPLQSQSTNNHFDSFSHHNHHHHHQILLPIHHHHHSHQLQNHEFLHHQSHNALLHHQIDDKAVKGHVAEIERSTTAKTTAVMVEEDDDDEPWGNEEILALLRIRSTTENWFPDFTWNQVSRKLAEIGFKLRSGEKCKEKFEEESRYFNNNNDNCSTKNFRPFLSELDELYNQSQTTQPQNDAVEVVIEPRKIITSDPIPIDTAAEDQTKKASDEDRHNAKKRKRAQVHIPSSSSPPPPISNSSSASNKFEMFKSFCEEIVKKMMAQQEEMHNKLMEDMVRRDEENSKKEQDWKRKETERMNKELESMAHEQALAGDRQSAIIEFLTKFSSDHTRFSDPIIKKKKEFSLRPSIAAKKVLPKTTITSSSSSTLIHEHNKSPNSENPSPQNPSTVTNNIHSPQTTDHTDGQSGKRWPRDEVLALINLRCSTLYSNNNGSSDNNNKGNNIPLWERISQGMFEMGFKRSAKRCKEKWENINKYFRKTKDANKKRSVDSRTCPYFDQLSTLYSKGTLVHHHNQDEDHHHNHVIDGVDHDHGHDHGQGERSDTTTTTTPTTNNNNNIIVPPAFDFEF